MYQFFDTLTDISGNALFAATVTVRNYPAGTLAAIYSTNGTASPITNSTVSSDITGQVSFYIPDGDYTLTYVYKGTTYKVRSPVQFLDPMGFVTIAESGTANNYVINDSRLPAQLFQGLKVRFTTLNASTAASTLNVNGTGAQPLVFAGIVPTQINGVVAGINQAEWTGTFWQLISPVLTASALGQNTYPRSAAETALAVTPTNFAYVWGHVHRYGALGDGSTDDRAAWQTAANVMAQGGGGEVTCFPFGNYRIVCGSTTYLSIQYCVKLNQGVKIAAGGATLNLECGSGNQTGIWLSASRTGIRDAVINLTSSGSPSSQGFFHACVACGLPNNVGDSPSSPDAAQFMTNWFVRNCTFANTGLRRPAIACIGGLNSGIIEGNYVPDTSTISGLVAMDWGNTGTVSSADIPTTRTNYDANLCYTTHPNNIVIRNNRMGVNSTPVSGDVGGFGVRVSGVYNVVVENLRIDSVQLAGYFHTGGDLGFEFAQTSQKRHAYQGNVCRNLVIVNAQSGLVQGVFVDTLGDNVYFAQFTSAAYTPISNPLWRGDVVIEDCSIVGQNADTTYGVRVIQASGVRVRRCNVRRWTYGVLVDEFTDGVDVTDCIVTDNRGNGVTVGLQQLREGTINVRVERNTIYGNGTDVTNPGLRIFRGKQILVRANIFGSPTESTQNFGIALSDVAGAVQDLKFEDNFCLGATVDAYALAGSSPADALKYRIISTFRDNSIAYGITALVAGQTYLPSEYGVIGQQRLCKWWNPVSSAPTDGTWYTGDKLFRSNEAAAAALGHSVTTAGTFGTLATITNGSTTNGSSTFTCSLTGITVTTTQASYAVVVSSATGIRAGMKCTITAAGITDAFILSVSGTTLQLDTQAKSNQAGVTFTTSGLIEGEVIHLDTTTPMVGAVILKITGTSVTVNQNFVNTQSGRTVTYETPIFKAWAAIAA